MDGCLGDSVFLQVWSSQGRAPDVDIFIPSRLSRQVVKSGERLELEWERGRMFDMDVAAMYCQMVCAITFS